MSPPSKGAEKPYNSGGLNSGWILNYRFHPARGQLYYLRMLFINTRILMLNKQPALLVALFFSRFLPHYSPGGFRCPYF